MSRLRNKMLTDLNDEKVRITLLEARKNEREHRLKDRILKNEASMCYIVTI